MHLIFERYLCNMSMSSRIEKPIVSTKRSLARLFARVLRFRLVGGLRLMLVERLVDREEQFI